MRAEEEALDQLVDHIRRSPRLRAAIAVMAMRIEQLDVLERAGFPVTHAIVTVHFNGAEVASAVEPSDGLQVRGGGHVRLQRGAP